MKISIVYRAKNQVEFLVFQPKTLFQLSQRSFKERFNKNMAFIQLTLPRIPLFHFLLF